MYKLGLGDGLLPIPSHIYTGEPLIIADKTRKPPNIDTKYLPYDIKPLKVEGLKPIPLEQLPHGFDLGQVVYDPSKGPINLVPVVSPPVSSPILTFPATPGQVPVSFSDLFLSGMFPDLYFPAPAVNSSVTPNMALR